MPETKEPKQKFIKFAPLITAPEPVNPSSIACSVDDYNLLHVKLGYYVLHSSQSLVTFTKRFKLETGEVCETNIRFEKDAWQCTIMLQWDPKNQTYETFYSSKYKTLSELMNRVKLTFDTFHEFFHSLCDSCCVLK